MYTVYRYISMKSRYSRPELMQLPPKLHKLVVNCSWLPEMYKNPLLQGGEYFPKSISLYCYTLHQEKQHGSRLRNLLKYERTLLSSSARQVA